MKWTQSPTVLVEMGCLVGSSAVTAVEGSQDFPAGIQPDVALTTWSSPAVPCLKAPPTGSPTLRLYGRPGPASPGDFLAELEALWG